MTYEIKVTAPVGDEMTTLTITEDDASRAIAKYGAACEIVKEKGGEATASKVVEVKTIDAITKKVVAAQKRVEMAKMMKAVAK